MWAGVRLAAPATSDLPDIAQLAVQVALGGALYGIAMLLFGRERVMELLELRRARG